MFRKLSFKNGVYINHKKELNENLAIEDFFDIKIVKVLLKQHIGEKSVSIVKIGDKVKKGQKIASGLVNQHSPISGEVIEIEETVHPIYGLQEAVVIQNDFLEEKSKEYDNCEKDYLNLGVDRLKNIIGEKGIVGLGGATFPTSLKINIKKNLELLLVNGAECEPYLNIDNRLMIEKAKELIEGIKILKKIMNPKKVIIGIEDNKKEAISHLKKLCLDENIDLKILKTKYPQGGEKQLIQTICKKEVKTKTIPIEIGIVVLNIGTIISIYEAVALGKPLIEKELTISGDGIRNKKNVRVKIGTLVEDILNYTGYDEKIIKRLILGGPMMGKSIENIKIVITKGVGGILALSEKESKTYKTKACILCGKCVYVCPMGLSPLQFVKFMQNDILEGLKNYRLNDCINCASCSYVCPSNRPLMEAIILGKEKLRKEI